MKALIRNIKQNINLVVVVLLIGLVAGFFIGRPSNSTGKKALSEQEEKLGKSEPQVWTCSMHPQIKQNKPGKCPICAMDLIPLESSGGDDIDPDEIQMTESAMKLAEIEIMEVKKDYSTKEIYLLGKIKPDERNIAELTARFGGRIEKLHVNFTGQNVQKGEKLATIYSPELVTAQKELLEAIEYKESNPSFYQAARNKLKLWDLTEKQIEGIETKGEPQNYFDVLSPISGTVTMRHVAIGDYVKEGSALFQVINLRKVWAMFEAYETDLPWLQKGDEVSFTVQSIPGETFNGKITYIDPFLNPKTRIANVRVEVGNANLELKPEMFANGIIKPRLSTNKKDLLIPKTSVLWTGKRSVVYVKVPEREKPSFLYRKITLGPEAGDFYVVKEGLSEGEEIATYGVFKIDAAAQLEGKPSMMNPEGGIAPTGHNHTDMKGKASHDHSAHAGEANLEHAEFRVSGNCEMCKNTIENVAGDLQGVNEANWNVKTKLFHISYNKDKITLNDIHKAIAKAGYDTEKETAPKEAYDQLPACCKYTRTTSKASSGNVEHAMFKVAGNCGMCKDRIEKAAKSVKGVNSAEWDEKTKMIHLNFNKDKTSLEAIHKAIATAGHDTEKETAPDKVYKELPDCCKYSRNN